MQLMKTREAIISKRADLRAFHNVDTIVGVLVTLDAACHVNADYFRSILESEVRESEPSLQIADYQVTDIGGLEDLFELSIFQSVSPAELVVAKLSDPKDAEKDFEMYFPYRIPGVGVPSHPLLRDDAGQLMDELTEAFRRKP